jgi:hypothetical protein
LKLSNPAPEAPLCSDWLWKGGNSIAKDEPLISEEQWEYIAPLLPEPKASPEGGPKPVLNRPVFEGILWVLRTGARFFFVVARDAWAAVRGGPLAVIFLWVLSYDEGSGVRVP